MAQVRIGSGIAGMIALRNLESALLGAPTAGRCPVMENLAAAASADRAAISRRHAAAEIEHRRRIAAWEYENADQ